MKQRYLCFLTLCLLQAPACAQTTQDTTISLASTTVYVKGGNHLSLRNISREFTVGMPSKYFFDQACNQKRKFEWALAASASLFAASALTEGKPQKYLRYASMGGFYLSVRFDIRARRLLTEAVMIRNMEAVARKKKP